MGKANGQPRGARLMRSLVPGPAGDSLPLLLALGIGVTAGIGAYTFSYAKGLSYFGTEPSACANCHIMEPQYAAWQKSSHHAVARCIDCHLPAAFIPKYLAKAENGYRHGKLFTTQTFEEPITIKADGLAILQENCESCHAALVHDLVHVAHPGANTPDGDRQSAAERALVDGVPCIHCHWTVGHGERAGLGGPLQRSELEGTPAEHRE